jgi:hypothetical protein
VTRSIEIGADADLGSWTSIGSLVRRDSIRVGGRAFNGESASCGFDVDDDSAAKSWPPHRVVRVIEDATSPDTTLGWCRVETDSSGRLGRFDGDARRFDVNLSDRNADVRGIVVTSWSRPAETDVARFRALVADWFDGSYRASTDLTDTYVRNANTVTLPAKKYDAVQAGDIAQEIADAAGKIWFITVDGEAFLDIETSTAYAAAISITDAGTDNQTTIFAPGFDGDAADRDKTEVLSGGVAPYGSSGHKVSERRSTKEAAGDRWEEVLSVDASTSADATSQLGKLLDSRQLEDLTVRCFLDLRADQVDVIKYGQTLSFRGAAAATTTPTTLRIAELTWEEIGKDLYRAHLELARPTKLGGRNKKGKGTPPPVFDDTPDTTTRTGVYLTIDGAPHSAVHVTADSPADGTKTFHFVVSLTDAFGGTPVQQNDPPYTESGSFTVDSAAGDGSGLQIRSGAAILIGPVDLPTNTPIYVWGQYTSSFGGTGYTDGGTDVVFTPAFGGWVPPSDITIVVTPAGSAAGGPGSQMRLCTFELTTVSTPPASGQLVPWEAPQETPDGTTSTFTVSSAVNGYVPGSLRVVVDGQPIVIGLTETDPTAGTFTLDFAPFSDESVRVSYIAA